MATMQYYLGASRKRTYEWLYDSVSNEWADASAPSERIFKTNYGSGLWNTIEYLQIKVPANALLASLSISSVMLKLWITDGFDDQSTRFGIAATNTDQATSGLSFVGSHYYEGFGVLANIDITSLVSGINKASDWYLQLMINSIAGDTSDALAVETALDGAHPAYLEITYTPTACTAPTLDLMPSVAEFNPTLSGGSAVSGSGNPIMGYEIQFSESIDGENWGIWAAEKTITTENNHFITSVAISPTRGYYRKWRVRTQGEAGASYYSAWVESSAVRRNRIPSSPASASASPLIYESGGVVLSWPAAADPDNNVTAYELQRAASADGVTWGNWVDVGTSITMLQHTDTPTIARGEYVKYRVRAKDTFGVTSEYVGSETVRRNQAPPAVTINHPQHGKATYNPRPRILITLGTEPDGQMQTLTSTGYTASNPGPYASGRKIVLRRTSAATAGGISVIITPKDAQNAEGTPSAIGMTYAVLSLSEPVTAGVTRVKAAHINELRAAIDTVRSYYGLPVYGWAEIITAGKTSLRRWVIHITELQRAIDETIAFINGWDASALSEPVAAPVWVAASKHPSANVLNQIRSVIPTLQEGFIVALTEAKLVELLNHFLDGMIDSSAVRWDIAQPSLTDLDRERARANIKAPLALLGDVTYYVNSETGNDANDGTSGSPFATIQHAVEMLPSILGGHNPTIRIAGTFTENINIFDRYLGTISLVFDGSVYLTGKIYVSSCSLMLSGINNGILYHANPYGNCFVATNSFIKHNNSVSLVFAAGSSFFCFQCLDNSTISVQYAGSSTFVCTSGAAGINIENSRFMCLAPVNMTGVMSAVSCNAGIAQMASLNTDATVTTRVFKNFGGLVLNDAGFNVS